MINVENLISNRIKTILCGIRSYHNETPHFLIHSQLNLIFFCTNSTNYFQISLNRYRILTIKEPLWFLNLSIPLYLLSKTFFCAYQCFSRLWGETGTCLRTTGTRFFKVSLLLLRVPFLKNIFVGPRHFQ